MGDLHFLTIPHGSFWYFMRASFRFEPAAHCTFSQPLFPAVIKGYRIAVASYFFGIMVWSISQSVDGGTGDYWIIYWTNWCTIQQVLYLWMAALVTLLYTLEFATVPRVPDGARATPPLLMLLTWISQNIIYSSSILVTLFYFGFVFPGSTSHISIQLRVGNTILMLVDLFCSGAPYHYLHCYQAMIYGFVFVAWTGIHYAADIGDGEGNRHIYGVLNWKHGGMIVGTTAVVILFYPFINVLLWLWWFLGNEVSDEDEVFGTGGQTDAAAPPVLRRDPTMPNEGGTAITALLRPFVRIGTALKLGGMRQKGAEDLGVGDGKQQDIKRMQSAADATRRGRDSAGGEPMQATESSPTTGSAAVELKVVPAATDRTSAIGSGEAMSADGAASQEQLGNDPTPVDEAKDAKQPSAPSTP